MRFRIRIYHFWGLAKRLAHVTMEPDCAAQRLVKGRALARPSERSERFEPLVRSMMIGFESAGKKTLHSPLAETAAAILEKPAVAVVL